LILSARRLSKVRPSVVAFNHIPVINLVGGPLAGHVKKRETMSHVLFAIDSDLDVSGSVLSPRHTARLNPSPANEVPKFTRFWVIAKNLLQTLLCKRHRPSMNSVTHKASNPERKQPSFNFGKDEKSRVSPAFGNI
jgi:hypothetical protein